MRGRVYITLALTVGVLLGTLLSPLGGALAGHTNTILAAELDGRQEVASGATNSGMVGDPNGRGEVYVFGIDEPGRPASDPRTTLCYVLTVDKIEPAMAAHIHRGAAGTNGPVVVNLAAPGDGDAADCLTEGEILPSGALAFPVVNGVTVTVEEILANPERFYVNVHNAEYPGGAIRGQLSGI